MSLILLLAVVLQEEYTIARAAKAPYIDAVKKFERAGELLESDPAQAEEILNGILDNAKVVHRDCRLKIQIRSSSFRKYDFFPHQLRGRARMKRAEKTPDEKLLKGAISDLEESLLRRKLSSSKPYLEAAQVALKKYRERRTKENPEPKFRTAWTSLINQGRFVDARAHVAKKGGFLSAEKRADYGKQTETASREFYESAVNEFLASLDRTDTPAALRAFSSSLFDRRFALPGKKELIVAYPAYDWAAEVRSVLEAFRKGKDVLDELLSAAVAGPKGGLAPLLNLSTGWIREELDRLSGAARDAVQADREKLSANATALVKKWDLFRGKHPKKGLKEITVRFPVDAPGMETLHAAIRGSADKEDPDRALQKIGLELEKLEKGFTRFTIESRREILRLRIVVAALRGLWTGKSESEIAREELRLSRRLKDLGGDLNVVEYGPRVAKIFERLR